MKKSRFPDRKISETLIDFAQPFVAFIDGGMTEAQIREGFRVAVVIWNVFVLDGAQGGTKYRDMLKAALGEAWQSNPTIRSLVRRRKHDFSDDMRCISEFSVRFDGRDLIVRAEARDPYPSEAGPGSLE